MPWLLIKARKTHFFGDKWQECEANKSAPSVLVRDGDLSTWLIAEDQSNLDRVVTALASNCDSLEDISFVLVSQQAVEKLQITISETPGDTPDTEANGLWHRDLVGLSNDPGDSTLFSLASAINTEHNFGKRSFSEVKKLIRAGLEAGQIDRTKIKPGIFRKLGQT